jgi:hypothetical protein
VNKNLKKVTVLVPDDLLQNALEASGDSISATVQAGLRLLCEQQAFKKLSKMRGKIACSIDVEALRSE